ncbi:hypothetical protein ACH414_19940 [Streptomyces sp. NPDC020422]|uniref:hypothetical protein n=1 Tax=Streptomyces sp. NPDC020422 TaxID=3365074 RepID=UPI0037B7AAF8
MANRSRTEAGDHQQAEAERAVTPGAEPAAAAEESWQTPGHTVVETALEVTGYAQATR